MLQAEYYTREPAKLQLVVSRAQQVLALLQQFLSQQQQHLDSEARARQQQLRAGLYPVLNEIVTRLRHRLVSPQDPCRNLVPCMQQVSAFMEPQQQQLLHLQLQLLQSKQQQTMQQLQQNNQQRAQQQQQQLLQSRHQQQQYNRGSHQHQHLLQQQPPPPPPMAQPIMSAANGSAMQNHMPAPQALGSGVRQQSGWHSSGAAMRGNSMQQATTSFTRPMFVQTAGAGECAETKRREDKS